MTLQITDQLSASAQMALSNFSDAAFRANALKRFQELGVPHKKTEDYKYSNLSNMLPPTLLKQEVVTTQKFEDLPTAYALYFNNGVYDESSSTLPEGVSITTGTQSVSDQFTDAMEALNEAVAIKTTIEIQKSKKIPLVAIVQQFSNSGLNHSSITVKAQALSESSFVEIFRDHESITRDEKCFVNALTTFELADSAHVLHQKVVTGGIYNHVIGKVKAKLQSNSNFNSQTMSVGADFVRSNIEVNIWGEGAHTTVNGLYATRGEQHHDNFSLINHHVGHTTSHQIYKGILDDKSRAAFTGKIKIHRDAQLVDSQQLNKNLLLDKKARIDTRPQLEVYADDVKCAHGATIGQMSEEELFYLESRGIEKSRAQKVLCHAFAGEVLLSCNDAALTDWLSALLFDQFEKYALDKLEANQ
jgi:Fe-S cluster assembly protein SufD